MKHKQLFLVVFTFLMTGACIILLSSPQVIGAMAGAFLTVVGAYTALDLKAIVKSTGALPSGNYAVADNWKYLSCVGLILLLLGACMVKQHFYDINLDLAYGLLGPGAVGIIGFIVAGMKLNKAATVDGSKSTRKAKGSSDD